MIAHGGIIAAGEGSRLRASGLSASKPMVPVAGRPLIAHAVERFRAAGIRRLTVIINEASEDCRDWLTRSCGDLALDLVVRTTPSSYASFRIVADRLTGAPAVVTTVDSIMATDDFRAFVEGASRAAADAVVLGLTEFVDDEEPLWVTLDPSDGRILRLGSKSGTHATAGLYALPAQRRASPEGGFDRLRAYLAWLVETGHPVHGIVLRRVFDIDRVDDIAAAERAVAEWDHSGIAAR